MNVIKFLRKCSLENKPVDMMYLDQKGRVTKRTIFVKKIDQRKVIAFCTLREQNRTFDLDNILAAQKGAYHEVKQTHTWSKSIMGVNKNVSSGA
jgi:predicted DNA-binding transcriptional regulator YafY